jgi:molybdopterin converting factor small subunit
MSVSVIIPTPLRTFADGSRHVAVNAETVGAALDEVTARYPRLRAQLFAGDSLRAFVNVFLNDENIRDIGGHTAALATGDMISIIPSIAGG